MSSVQAVRGLLENLDDQFPSQYARSDGLGLEPKAKPGEFAHLVEFCLNRGHGLSDELTQRASHRHFSPDPHFSHQLVEFALRCVRVGVDPWSAGDVQRPVGPGVQSQPGAIVPSELDRSRVSGSLARVLVAKLPDRRTATSKERLNQCGNTSAFLNHPFALAPGNIVTNVPSGLVTRRSSPWRKKK